MNNKWEKYSSPQQDTKSRWDSYSTTDSNNNSGIGISDVIGSAFGLVAGGAGAYGAYKAGRIAAKGAGFVAKAVKNMPKVLNVEKGADFAQQIRKAFVEAHTEQTNKFGAKIAELSVKKPNVNVSLESVVEDLKSNWNDLNNETKSVIKKTPVLRDMFSDKNPKLPKITLKQSQDVINYLNTKIPKNIRYNNLDVIELVNGIRGSQLADFPEMAGTRAEYSKFIKPYKNIKEYFKFNKLLDSIKNKFGGAEGQSAVEKVLPKDVIKKMGGYRAAAKLWQPVRSISRGLLGIAPVLLDAYKFAQDPNKGLRETFTPEMESIRDELSKIPPPPQGTEKRKIYDFLMKGGL